MRILYHPKRILGFETYCAPEGFDRKAQPVDIYDVFERYYRNHRTAKYIYYVGSTSSYSELMFGTSYRYGYNVGGIDYTIDIDFNGTRTSSTNILAGSSHSYITVDTTDSFPSSGVICLSGAPNHDRNEYFVYSSKDATKFYGTSKVFTYAHFSGSSVFYTIDWGSGLNRYVIVNNTDTSMQDADFRWQRSPEWVYLGDKIKNIYNSGGGGSISKLKWIHIHDLSNLVDIQYASFYGSKLEGIVYIPDSITNTNAGLCFASSIYITGIVISPHITTLGNRTFQNCTGLNGTLTIPNSCTKIDYNAFYNCNKLDTLDLGTGVQTIGNSAFESCTQLSGTLTLPNSLTTIGTRAFYGCTSLSGTLTLPNSLTTIGTLAFYGCTSYNGSLVLGSGITSIGQGAFGDDNFSDIDVTANSRYEDVDDVLYEISTRTALHSVKSDTGTITFQSNTLIIGNYCCYVNKRTGTLTVPDSVTRVGIYAFYDCNGFTAIVLETTTSSLAIIDDYAFNHCSSMAGALVIPNSVTLINTRAFRDCSKVTGLSFGTGLITIGTYAFYNLPLVTSLTLPNSLVTIEQSAFEGLSALTGNIVIPNSVETIGANVFFGSVNVTGTLTLGTGLKTIGGLAFGIVPFTGTLAIPSLVTSIGENAFRNNNFSAVSSAASGFTVSDYVLYDETVSGQIKAHTSARGYSGTLTFKAGTTSILSSCLFNNDNRTGAIVIPYTVTAIGQNAFDDCGGFNSTATIGDGTNGSALATIAAYAFRNCPNITLWNFYNNSSKSQIAPTCSTATFGNYAKQLHILTTNAPAGFATTPATVAAPWTNTAIFSSIIADL